MEKQKAQYATEKAAREALHRRLTLERTLDVIGGSVVHCDDDLCQARVVLPENWHRYYRDEEVKSYGPDANGNFWWLPDPSGWSDE